MALPGKKKLLRMSTEITNGSRDVVFGIQNRFTTDAHDADHQSSGGQQQLVFKALAAEEATHTLLHFEIL